MDKFSLSLSLSRLSNHYEKRRVRKGRKELAKERKKGYLVLTTWLGDKERNNKDFFFFESRLCLQKIYYYTKKYSFIKKNIQLLLHASNYSLSRKIIAVKVVTFYIILKLFLLHTYFWNHIFKTHIQLKLYFKNKILVHDTMTVSV